MRHADPCPECGAPLEAARQPTDAERAAVHASADHSPLPPSWDTATPEQIADHGPLYRCVRCPFSVRLKDAAAGNDGMHV